MPHPDMPVIRHLEVVYMPNGELIHCGKSLLYVKEENQKYIHNCETDKRKLETLLKEVDRAEEGINNDWPVCAEEEVGEECKNLECDNGVHRALCILENAVNIAKGLEPLYQEEPETPEK